jgi:type I restriction enzyme M protein
MGKTNSLNENDLEDFIKLAKTQKLSDNSWSIDVEKINKETLDLAVQNPNIVEEIDERTPSEIISEIEKLDKESNKIINKIKELL